MVNNSIQVANNALRYWSSNRYLQLLSAFYKVSYDIRVCRYITVSYLAHLSFLKWDELRNIGPSQASFDWVEVETKLQLQLGLSLALGHHYFAIMLGMS